MQPALKIPYPVPPQVQDIFAQVINASEPNATQFIEYTPSFKSQLAKAERNHDGLIQFPQVHAMLQRLHYILVPLIRQRGGAGTWHFVTNSTVGGVTTQSWSFPVKKIQATNLLVGPGESFRSACILILCDDPMRSTEVRLKFNSKSQNLEVPGLMHWQEILTFKDVRPVPQRKPPSEKDSDCIVA